LYVISNWLVVVLPMPENVPVSWAPFSEPVPLVSFASPLVI
jgi:hypothetical protein